MECRYFGVCGSCSEYSGGYEAQLQKKLIAAKSLFKKFYHKNIEVFRSKESHYRARAEFRIWHTEDTVSYAMTSKEKQPVLIEECPQVSEAIASLMPRLLEEIKAQKLTYKLFGIDFLSSTTGDMVVSLLYHRKLDEEWERQAALIAQKFSINIIGRSRKQKVVIGNDFVIERLGVGQREFVYKHIENSFTQPNPTINAQMIEWALGCVEDTSQDLLELYCGAGNFTIPFATKFRRVLATEISKSSIAAAKENMRLNGVENIEFVRMSVEEFTEALEGKRTFRRLAGIDLDTYEIQSVFVDPPRAGMDERSCRFVARFENIIYISCNPLTLARDLELLTQTHTIEKMALFDQFPYTHHTEMGVALKRRIS